MAVVWSVACCPSAAPAADKDLAASVPADCFLIATIPNVTKLTANFKKTGLYGLYKEPAMQQFLVPAEKNLRKLIKDELTKALKGTGLEPTLDALPWPKGQVTLAIRMAKKTVSFPVYDWANYSGEGKPKILRHDQRSVMSQCVIVLADMGENIGKARKFLDKIADRQVEEANWKRIRKTVRGVRLSILLPPGTKRPEDDDDIVTDGPIYGFKGKTLVAGTNLKLIREVLGIIGGEDRKTLASDAGYRTVMRRLGGGDIALYLNVKSLLEIAKAEAAASKQREEADRIMRALGVDAVTGLGVVMQVAAKDNEQLRIKALLGVRGERRGLLAMLTPTAKPTRPGRLLTRGLAGFFVANYDLGKMYDQLVAIVREASRMDIDKVVQQAMAATKPPIGGEPVNVHKEILGQLSGPITITTHVSKPYTAPGASRTMLAIGVRDGGILDIAIGRLHNILIAGGNEKLRRKLRNRSVYLLSGDNPVGLLVGMALGEGIMPKAPLAAMTVADDNFVVGTVKTVEQAVRDLDRKDIEPIGSDPMYQYAARGLPAQAVLYAYQNQQISTALAWARLRAAGKEAAKQPAKRPRTTRPGIELGLSVGSGPNLPMMMLVRQLGDFCDFAALPEFERVRKYYGPIAGYITGIDEGIFAEMIELKAPGD